LAEIDSILLGDNPFFGVDHLSQERAREKANQSQNFDNMLGVIKYSLNAGAKGMVVSTHPKLKDLIDHIIFNSDLIDKLNFFPILPYIQGYVLKINEKGIVKTLIDALNPPTGFQNKLKILTKGGLGAMRKDLFELFKVLVDVELARFPNNAKIKTIFLHDVLTDLALSLDLKNVFETFQTHIQDTYNREAGVVTKNFPKLVSKLKEWNLEFSTIMTSFNKVGFQMNPSKQACEDCLLSYDGNLVAMSVFAGGYLTPQEGYQYVSSQPKIRTVVIGISSIDHAKNTFELFLNKKESLNF
jgi:hypothetical protein